MKKFFIIFVCIALFVVIITLISHACPPLIGFFDLGLNNTLSSRVYVLGEVISLHPDSSLFMTKLDMKIYQWIGVSNSDSFITAWKCGLQGEFGTDGGCTECSSIIYASRVYLVPILNYNGPESDSIKFIFPNFREDILAQISRSSINTEMKSNRVKVLTQLFQTRQHVFTISLDKVDSVYFPGQSLILHSTVVNKSNDTLYTPTESWNDLEVRVMREGVQVAIFNGTPYFDGFYIDKWWFVNDTAGTVAQNPSETREYAIDLTRRFPALKDTVLSARATQLIITGILNYAFNQPYSSFSEGLRYISSPIVIDIDQVQSVYETEEVATRFHLSQNYPNPFNPTTTISFDISQKSFVTLKVYDVLGREVATVVNQELTPDSYTREFDASGLSSGVYIYRLTALHDNKLSVFSQKMMLLK